MDPLSMEGNTESINSSHGRSIENPHLSHIEKRRAMHPKNRIDIIDNSCLNDFQSTAWAFFSGLEDNADSPLDFRFSLLQQWLANIWASVRSMAMCPS